MKEALRDKKIRIAAALLLMLAISAFAVFFYQIGKARKALVEVRKNATQKDLVAIQSRSFSLAPDPQAQLLSQPFTIRKVVPFHGLIYAATSNGLVAYTEDGKQIEHWTTLEGFPSQDLTALAVFNDSLWIGTSDSGLIRYKDQQWTHFLPQKNEYRFIHSLHST